MRLVIRYFDCIRVTSANTRTKITEYRQFCTQICSRHCLQCIAMLANIEAGLALKSGCSMAEKDLLPGRMQQLIISGRSCLECQLLADLCLEWQLGWPYIYLAIPMVTTWLSYDDARGKRRSRFVFWNVQRQDCLSLSGPRYTLHWSTFVWVIFQIIALRSHKTWNTQFRPNDKGMFYKHYGRSNTS